MPPGCASSLSLPSLCIGHPMVVTPSAPEHGGRVQWWHQETPGAWLPPVPAAPCTGPEPAAVEAGGGELERLGREVWEPCRNAGLGAGACQAQMGSLVVVKIIQPLLKTQAQQPDPAAPGVAIPTGAGLVFASPAITTRPWIWGHSCPSHATRCPLQCQGEGPLSPPCPRDGHPAPTPTPVPPLLGKPHPCGCSHPWCRFLFLF